MGSDCKGSGISLQSDDNVLEQEMNGGDGCAIL